jgi:hypothetical protein
MLFEGMRLPIYKLTIRPDAPDTGAEYTALVDEPATEKYFLAFNKEKSDTTYQPERQFFASQEQRIISGPLMIPNLPIYRRPSREIPEEHYVVFDAETIRQIVYKFCREGNFNQVNLMHKQGSDTSGVYMIESFISDERRGISAPTQFQELPEGTWFVSYKVDNDNIWQRIKNAEFKGLSIEGIFSYVEAEESEEERLLYRIESIIKRMKK